MKRIGLLLPSSNTRMEPDFYTMAPEYITIHSSRMFLQEVSINGLEKMAEDAVNAAKLLSTADVDIIIYGCTSGSLLKGLKWEENLVQKIQTETMIPTITTAGAVVKALREVKAASISVLTPYIEEINNLEKKFFEAHGFNVTNIKGLGLTDNIQIGKVSHKEIMGLIDISINTDCLFISCTNLSVVRLIQELECRLNIPVVTSNQASIWLALRTIYNKPIEGYGKLLQLPRAQLLL